MTKKKKAAPSSNSGDAAAATSATSKAAHRDSLRQRRTQAVGERTAMGASTTLDEALPALLTDDTKTPSPPRSAPRSSPSPSSTNAYLGQSPRHEGFMSGNMFRAAKGSDMESMMLFREQPRQIAVLALVVAAVSYFSFTHDSHDVTENVRNGLTTGILIFLVYCFLQTRDGLMVRPHPGLWRVVHGCSVVYLLLLAAMSVQNRTGAILSMQFLFPEVGSLRKTPVDAPPLDCDINAQTIYRGISSIWFLAHVTGWWGKMCMFRDWRFCWVLSIAFEILELALQFVIPDFQECWWDSLFMDLFGANLLGMFLGRLTLAYCETKEYDWSGKRDAKMGYVLRVLNQFTPIISWSQYHWEVFSSVKRFSQILFALFVCLLVELNAFFLLNTLSIPKESNFNAYRLSLMFLLGIPGAAEYYEFLSNPKALRLGQNAWMMLSIAVFEVLVWVKFSANGVLFTDAPPLLVAVPLVAFATMFSAWMACFFFFAPPSPSPLATAQGTTTAAAAAPWGKLDVLFWLSFTPLLLLTSQWAY